MLNHFFQAAASAPSDSDNEIDNDEQMLGSSGIRENLMCTVKNTKAKRGKRIPESDVISKGWPCAKCNRRFQTKETLEVHLFSHHTPQPKVKQYSCDVCERLYSNLFGMKSHIRRHKKSGNDKASFSCNECLMPFADASALTDHMNTLHEQNISISDLRLPCDKSDCNRSFVDLRSLRVHNARCHRPGRPAGSNVDVDADEPSIESKKGVVKRWLCMYCLRPFENEIERDLHVETYHHKLDEYHRIVGCRECGKPFTESFSLEKHLFDHELAEKEGQEWNREKEGRTCNLCRTVFASTEALQEHSCHVVFYQCHLCPRKFRKRVHIRVHLRRHMKGEINFVCPICGVLFDQERKLAMHKATHFNDSKPFKCDICGTGLVNMRALTRHKRRHNSKYQNVCHVCGEAIGRRRDVDQHMLSKHGLSDADKPFSCDKCSKGFFMEALLKDHARVHVRKPFSVPCKKCGKKLPSRVLLRIHDSEVHQEKPGGSKESNEILANNEENEKPANTCESKELKSKTEGNKSGQKREVPKKKLNHTVVCPVCSTTLLDYMLTQHLLGHKANKRKCARCFAFVLRRGFDFHKLCHPNPNTLVYKHCRLCGEVLDTVSDVYKHCMEHAGLDVQSAVFPHGLVRDILPITEVTTDWHCTTCSDQSFQSEDAWMAHIEEHSFGEEDPTRCNTCDGYFFDKMSFVEHAKACARLRNGGENESSSTIFYGVRPEQNNKEKPNDICTSPKESSSDNKPDLIDSHVSSCAGSNLENGSVLAATNAGDLDQQPDKKEPYYEPPVPKDCQSNLPMTCVLCFRLFASGDGLAYHLLTTCNEIEDDKCWRCQESFGSKEYLTSHVHKLKRTCKVAAPIGKGPIVCSDCDKEFEGEIFLSLHKAQCHDPGSYHCVKCSRQFEYRRQLEMHVVQHLIRDNSSISCMVCGHVVNRLFDLQEHMMVHDSVQQLLQQGSDVVSIETPVSIET